MSFSADVKTELCRVPLTRDCCARAEAYGVLLCCHTFHSRAVKIVTECPEFMVRLPALFQRAFQLDFDETPATGERKGTFAIRERNKLRRIFEAFGHEMDLAPSVHINFAAVEENCCRLSLFRGTFLAGGSVTDPHKSYHLELSTAHYHVGRELPVLLREAGFEAKVVTRKSNYITYFKHSDHIADFLAAIGAPNSAKAMRESRRERDLRGSVNRRVNCDSANLDKTVEAAQRQIDAIHLLETGGYLAALPENLRQTACLRLDFPELTLTQLAEQFVPPISKSALNHRLRKLVDLAESQGRSSPYENKRGTEKTT